MRLRKLMAMTVAGAMMMANICPVMADTIPSGTESQSVPQSPVEEAVIVEYMKMARGTKVPNATFTYDISPYSDSSNPDSGANMPQAFTTSISTSDMKHPESLKTNNNLVGTKTVAEIFKDKEFDHAAEYVYKVTQKNSGLTEDKDPDTKESMQYDRSSYLLHLYVANTESGGLEIKNVTVSDGKDKRDPSAAPTDDKEAANSGFTFVNSYTKMIHKAVIDPENPDDPSTGTYGALGVTENVSGDYGDKTKEFSYTLTLTAPDNYISSDSVNAIIYSMNEDGTVNKEEQSVSYNTPFEFNLKDNERIGFAELPSGTAYSITHGGARNYTPSYKIGEEIKQGTLATDLALENRVLSDTNNGENVDVTDTFNAASIAPTGIVMEEFPYILLLVLAGGATAAFVVREKDERDI
ncbi:MAG: hypothetical protein U0K57_03350 [Lachnospiraceae bacterium]|nr:hypothetical protein [Lachnospiraceae bacterium]